MCCYTQVRKRSFLSVRKQEHGRSPFVIVKETPPKVYRLKICKRGRGRPHMRTFQTFYIHFKRFTYIPNVLHTFQTFYVHFPPSRVPQGGMEWIFPDSFHSSCLNLLTAVNFSASGELFGQRGPLPGMAGHGLPWPTMACHGRPWKILINILGTFWEHFENILGTFWDHFGNILGTFWEHFGITLGTFWEHFGNILGTF